MDEELDISDVNGICRLCLKDDCTIIPIFGRENTSRNGIPLSKKILDCVSVKVSDGDGLPSMICVGCVHQVDSWQGFKNNCEDSQRKLNCWLQKTNPEIFAKNEAEKRRERRETAETSDVIDLSSEEDDLVLTHQPKSRQRDITRIYKNQVISHFKNPELLIKTNEVEILPVKNIFRNEKDCAANEDISSPDSDLPDRLTGVTIPETDNFEDDSSEDQIWSNAETTDPLGNNDHMEVENEVNDAEITKDTLPKDPIDNDHPLDKTTNPSEKCNDSATSNKQNNIEDSDENINGIDKVTNSENGENNVISVEKILNSEEAILNETPEAVDPSGISTMEIEETKSHSPHKDVLTNNDNVDLHDKIPKDDTIYNINQSMTIEDRSSDHENKTSEKNSNTSGNLGQSENSLDDSSSLVIEKVTSLNNPDVNPSIRGTTEENVDKELSNENWESQSQNNDSQDVEPDIIFCDSITSVVSHIKEEPLSADEAEGEEDEEDPLNFHSVLLKREMEEFVDESEDVKPNLELLNEAMESQYTPKRLKNGKVHCEPCRVSFSSDVYYERHSNSLRHRMNLKLYKLGKGPTRARGKALINVAMGNIGNYVKGTGPYCCTQCPSRFKHKRNLHTHNKKHLMEVRVSARKLSSETVSQTSDLEIADVTTNLNVREDLKCELCLQSFMSVPALVSHKRFCGVSEKQLCTHCGQSFTTQSLFVKHRKDCLKDYRRSIFNEQRLKEEEINNRMTPPPLTPPKPPTPAPVPLDGSVLACTLCNLSFQTSTDLINHMQQNHMDFGKIKNNPPPELPDFAKPNHFSRSRDSRLHYCKYCLRSFPTLGALSSHTGYHARKSAYCCKFCRQTFKDKIGFRQHIKVHIADPNLNKNVCWMCYTPFASQKDLIDHKAIHVNVKLKVFSCSICGNSYNSKELLSKHRRSAHMMPIANPDNDMEVVQSNETSYHQMIEEDNKLFKCRVCKKRFTTLGNLKRHSLKHKPGFINHIGNFHTDYSFQHRCNWCFKGFKTQTGLLNHKPFCTRFRKTGLPHVNNVHTGALKCKDCKRWFASQNSIYKHKLMKRCRPIQLPNEEETVAPIRAQNCTNCDQQFLSEESLNRHKQNCKPSIEKLTCDCGEVFGSVELKQSHAETCASNCTCKNCNMKFNSPEELESHQSICQTQSQNSTPITSPYVSTAASFTPESRFPVIECAKCKKKFVYVKCLQMHEDKCLYDRWPCSNCLEIFPTETALATHKSHKSCQSPRHSRSSSVTSVNDGPTFKCESCPERFVSANELREHSMTCEGRISGIEPEGGSGERPFKCDQCDKTFMWKVNVQRHRKLAHKHLYQPETELTPIRKNPEREASTFRCKVCPDIVFHKQQGLLEHQRIHENEEEETAEKDTDESGVLLTCELCDKKLPEALYPLHMDEHMNDDFEESQEIETPPVECELGESYSCDICGKQFSTPQSRKSHRASHWRHYTTGYVPTLEPSLRKKYKVKHVRCNICNKMLSINSLPKHKMMHRREAADFYGGENSNQTPHKPNQSLSASTSASRSSTPNIMIDLSSNQEEENEEASSSIFPCPKCDKTFKLRKLLLEHLKNHMDESSEPEGFSSAPGTVDQYPYKCVYCDLSWRYKSVYERHLSSKKHLEIQKQLSGII